jgi:hypothetical protein
MMRQVQKLILDAQAITGTSTYTSAALDLSHCLGFTVLLVVASTATGTAKLQGSMDGTTWFDLPNSGATANIAVSGAGNYLWNVADAFYPYVRVSYTNSTNSGTLSARINAKGL